MESDEVGVPITKPFSYFNQDLFASLPITGNNGETSDEEILKVNPDVIIANTCLLYTSGLCRSCGSRR